MTFKIKEEIAKSRKVALYASLDSSYCYVSEVDYDDYDEHWEPYPDGQVRERQKKGYVRISEPVGLSLTAISSDSIVENAVKSLDEAERSAIREMNEKIAAIRGQKAQLLSLTHQSESV